MKYFFKRTFAYLIDCILCYSFVMLIIQWAILSNIRESIGITNDWFMKSLNMELYVLFSISIPVWVYFAYFDSNRGKRTFGKRVLKLSVLDNENRKITFGKSFKRTLLKLAPWEIAHIGVIFPTPMYFENEPDIRILTIVGILLFVVYIASILLNSDKQSIYDKLIGTKVVIE